jgi:ribosomal protein L21
LSIKHKRRKGYYKKTGHRQKYTQVKISAINA